MIKKIVLALTLISISSATIAADGVINVRSNHPVDKTADKLEQVLSSKGMKIFQRINHTAGAKTVDIELRPTELIIFGNPKVGSPLMKCAQTVAIDLPQKALIWEDAKGLVWISYNDPAYLQARHDIQGCDAVLNKVSGALSKLTGAAAK